MKVLFLDHLGVMVPYSKENIEYGVIQNFNPECVFVLNEIIQKTDCEIVVSSDWKRMMSFTDMQNFYLNQGVIKKPLSFTPDISIDLINGRMAEILQWLRYNNHLKIQSWVAVDDLPLMDLENFVWIKQTDKGLNQSEVFNQIIAYLL